MRWSAAGGRGLASTYVLCHASGPWALGATGHDRHALPPMGYAVPGVDLLLHGSSSSGRSSGSRVSFNDDVEVRYIEMRDSSRAELSTALSCRAATASVGVRIPQEVSQHWTGDTAGACVRTALGRSPARRAATSTPKAAPFPPRADAARFPELHAATLQLMPADMHSQCLPASVVTLLMYTNNLWEDETEGHWGDSSENAIS